MFQHARQIPYNASHLLKSANIRQAMIFAEAQIEREVLDVFGVTKEQLIHFYEYTADGKGVVCYPNHRIWFFDAGVLGLFSILKNKCLMIDLKTYQLFEQPLDTDTTTPPSLLQTYSLTSQHLPGVIQPQMIFVSDCFKFVGSSLIFSS